MGVGAKGQGDHMGKHSKLQSESTRKSKAQGAEDQTSQLEMGCVFMNELSPLNFMLTLGPMPLELWAA